MMKKLLAMMMAAAITVSAGLTNIFAASTNATFELDLSAADAASTDVVVPAGAKLDAGKALLTVSTDGGSMTFKSKKDITKGDPNWKIAEAFAGTEAEMRSGGILYTTKLALKLVDSNHSYRMTATVYPAGKVPFNVTGVSLSPTGAAGTMRFTNNSVSWSGFTPGTGGTNDTNNRTIDIQQVLYCDSNGVAIPLVEDKKDLNGTGDGVRSGTDVYFLVNAPFDNETYFKLRATKGSNSKNIDKIEVKSKYFTKELYKVYGGTQLSGGLTTGRHTFIKVPTKELYTDDEYKITFDLKVSLTSSGESKFPNYQETSIKADDVTAIWLKNKVADGDGEYRVGDKGMMIKPLANDWNEITWYNEARDLARLNFFADSDVDPFYCKLSTKWSHEDYYTYFNGQDAFMFSFPGAPKLSSTSRADLEIYQPFLDSDDKLTVDPNSITIYQVIDGDLVDITDKWTYKENDDGYMVYSMRTRFLGTYIFAEKPVKEAVKDVEEITPEAQETLPEISAPELDPNVGGKVPANTGRYA